MTLDMKKWKTILNVTGDTDILEHIKAKLKEQDESVYQEWEQSHFNLSYLFSVSIGDKVNEVTLLHMAVANGHLNVVEYLIKNGAKIDEKDIKSTPLHMAVANGHLNVVEYLIEKGDKIDGSTYLHMAVLKPNSELNEVDTQQKVSQQRN